MLFGVIMWEYKEANTLDNTTHIALEHTELTILNDVTKELVPAYNILSFTKDNEQSDEEFRYMVKEEIKAWLDYLNTEPKPVDATNLFNPGE